MTGQFSELSWREALPAEPPKIFVEPSDLRCFKLTISIRPIDLLHGSPWITMAGTS
jgi:hypothetical protein